MANTIQHKRSTTASSVPSAGQLAVGELALNLTDKKIYSKDGSGNVVEMSPTVVADGSITVAKLSATGTPSSSTYLRGDGSWQSPAGGVTSLNGQTGAITNTTYGAIGSYVVGGPSGVGALYDVGSTIAGSGLYKSDTSPTTSSVCAFSMDDGYVPSIYYPTSMGLTGTWRAMGRSYNSTNSTYQRKAGNLWVRVS